ncbi:pyridoxal-phosphate dependent enzyme [Streptomyces coffeae]|uniref:Pyridoxal-phosphate dependent enzyme n=1 Tax=Streptomyces coffeae TaxID=621382 RepID=A0ABS1NEP1_9ACTN|nr:pyridoxal-phosphate dependent enzyme [Streptomyces coffeae]MBL1098567.1 pyridoxal-phosphate dependent enzyme [Streptomyces coffeae]
MSAVDPRVWAADALRRIQADGARITPTPLRPLHMPALDGIDIYLKDESALPSGSMKYRLVRAMFCKAVAGGEVSENTPVFAATGGAVAAVGARFAKLLGLPFTAVVPTKTPTPLLDRIEREGGRWQVGERPPAAVQEEARTLAERHRGYVLDHFADAERAVADCGGPTIADEIFGQMRGQPHPVPEWIVTGAGTGATSATIGRHLRRHSHATRLAVVDPEHSAYFPAWTSECDDYTTGMPSRIPGIGRPRVEPGFTPDVIDLVIPVPDAASIAAMRWLHTVADVKAGPATGTHLWGVCHLVARMRAAGIQGSVITLVGDSAEPYRTTHLSAEWVHAQGLDPAPYEADLERFARTGKWPPGHDASRA